MIDNFGIAGRATVRASSSLVEPVKGSNPWRRSESSRSPGRSRIRRCRSGDSRSASKTANDQARAAQADGVALLACKRASISRPAAINVKSLKRHLISEGPTDANAYASLVCTYARWPLLASCGKYLRCISCRTWLCRCPEAGHQQQIVCSLTPCRFATTAIGSRSPRRRIATTCSSVNFDLRNATLRSGG